MNTCPLWGTGGKSKEYFVATLGRPRGGFENTIKIIIQV